MKKPIIVIVIPCWKRSNVVQLVMKQLDVFYRETIDIIELTVLYVFSQEDPELLKLAYSFETANHKRDYIFSPNDQLGEKLNSGIDYAKKFEYDYIMNFGSDDFIHSSLIDTYMPFLRAEVSFFGINNLYFYEKGKCPVFFSYYNKPHLIGAGRMIHRRVVERVKERFGGLYGKNLKRGMDTFSAKRIMECGYEQVCIDIDIFPMIVDIKSDVNINSFNSVSQHCTNENQNIKFLEYNFPLLNQL